MGSDKKILIVFLLNIVFSVFELIGGTITGSIAILSDAVHDFADSVSIGISYVLEKISKKKPDEDYTYGYTRYSLLGSLITTFVLIVGSFLVIVHAVNRLIYPTVIDHNGMILFAIAGVVVNAAASLLSGGGSLNQRAVRLHMMEDVLGWVVVLVGAIMIRLTGIVWIDPILSIGVACFILKNAIQNLKNTLDIFLDKTPADIQLSEVVQQLRKIEGVLDIHHVHIRSLDGVSHAATLHAVVNGDRYAVLEEIKKELAKKNIVCVTVETETLETRCIQTKCTLPVQQEQSCQCHHHHHH